MAWLVSVEVNGDNMKNVKTNKKAKKIALDLEILELEAKIAPSSSGQPQKRNGAEC